MSAELWSAILNPRGPNYEHWFRILGGPRVPLQSSQAIFAELGGEKNVEVYLLRLEALTLGQRARLLGFIAHKFGTPIYDVEAEIKECGFPIRAEDVIVSYNMRAFA